MLNRAERYKDDYLKRVYNLVLAVFPILGMYKSPIESVNLGELVFMAVIPLFISEAIRRSVKWDAYWLFLVWTAITTFTVIGFEVKVDLFNVIFMYLRLCFHAIIYLWLARLFFDIRLFMRIYRAIVYIAVGFIFIQYIVYHLTGSLIPYLIPFLKLKWTITEPSQIYAFRLSESRIRLSSFFVEPANFAQYVMPCFIYILFDREKKSIYDTVGLLAICVCTLIATSASFIVSIAAMLFVWFISVYIRRRAPEQSIMLSALAASAVALALWILYSNGVLDTLFSRLSEVDPDKGATSGNMRVMRGFAVFHELDIPHKLFGVGTGNTYGYMINHGLHTQYDYSMSENQLNYMNGFSNILVWGGLTGAAAYCVWLASCFSRCNRQGRALIVYLVILLFSASIYVMPVYVLLMAMITGSKGDNCEEGLYINTAQHR